MYALATMTQMWLHDAHWHFLFVETRDKSQDSKRTMRQETSFKDCDVTIELIVIIQGQHKVVSFSARK